jgi:hypothetical protein
MLALLVSAGWVVFGPPFAGAGDAPRFGATADADVIVLGECAAERSEWDESASLITTTVEIRPLRFYKGEPSDRLTVKTLGGRVGGESMSASHGATLHAGEQVLLFLRRSELGDYYVVAGGEAGKVKVAAATLEAAGTLGTPEELQRLLSREPTP